VDKKVEEENGGSRRMKKRSEKQIGTDSKYQITHICNGGTHYSKFMIGCIPCASLHYT
jgi:hypothetical protein